MIVLMILRWFACFLEELIEMIETYPARDSKF